MRARVIQGSFPRGVLQPKCTTPRCFGPRCGHTSIQRHASGNANAFRLPENLTTFTEVGGQPLPPHVRQKMEAFFKTNFSDVRVHVGPQASSIGALAFTQGSHIHFAPGHYNPSSPQGQAIIGHELAHVMQQRSGRVRNPFGSGVAVVQDRRLEAEADVLGMRAASHQVSGGR